jgi:hypothetical protein
MENGDGQLLTSWKEIAAHLGKGVRTVQRWESELGLPVRRPSQSRHIVVAITSELDEWVKHLSQPMSSCCCSCRQELELAKETISTLREQLAALESEMKSAMLALQINTDTPTMKSTPADIGAKRQLDSDGSAA